MSSKRPEPVNPIRWVIRHLHGPLLEDGQTQAPTEEVYVSYSAQLKDALMYAINTASRYGGVIYWEEDDVEGAPDGSRFHFFRSYRPKSRRANSSPSGNLTNPVLA